MLVAVLLFLVVKYQVNAYKLEKAERKIAELIAAQMPDTSKADTVIVYYADSTALKKYEQKIHNLQIKILRMARTPAETIQVTTYLQDTLKTAIAALRPCDKRIIGRYLYQKNGIVAHIASETDCRHDSVIFTVGAYAEQKTIARLSPSLMYTYLPKSTDVLHGGFDFRLDKNTIGLYIAGNADGLGATMKYSRDF